VGVTGYRIKRDGTELDTVNGSTTTYTDTGLQQGVNTYTWQVEARDAAGNWSTAIIGQLTSGQNPLIFDGAFLTTATSSSNTSDTGASVDGSTSVPVRPTIKFMFQRSVTQDDIWSNNKTCFTMKDSSGASVAINVFRISNGTEDNPEERRNIFITPLSDLTPGKTYEITISKNLVANNGETFGEAYDGKDVVISFTVAGATTSSLSAANASGAPGAVIQVPVNLTSTGEVVALQFDLSYDPSLLTYQQTSAGSLTSAFTVSANKLADNKVRVIIYNSSNTAIAAGSDTVALLQFQVATTPAVQACALGLSGVVLSDTQSQAITTTVNNGQFKASQAEVTLDLSKTTASVGETVTASGTTAPNELVPLKVVDAAQSIVVFDTTKADANGNYSIDFKVPADATGPLIVVVGEGSNVATKSLTIAPKDECFIATAAYGSKFEPAVVLLRQFRDKFLLTNSLGRAYVDFYYHNSPQMAKFIAGSEPLKFVVRTLLTPIVAAVYLLFHPVWIGVIAMAIGFWWVYRRRIAVH